MPFSCETTFDGWKRDPAKDRRRIVRAASESRVQYKRPMQGVNKETQKRPEICSRLCAQEPRGSAFMPKKRGRIHADGGAAFAGLRRADIRPNHVQSDLTA
jgi:hypothetical protein